MAPVLAPVIAPAVAALMTTSTTATRTPLIQVDALWLAVLDFMQTGSGLAAHQPIGARCLLPPTVLAHG